LGLALLLLTPGCSDAVFHDDSRVAFRTPVAESTVRLPLVLRWQSHGIRLADPGVAKPGTYYFAVFLDRRPLAPGESLLSLVDDECVDAGHGCADRAYFERRNVFLTAGTSLSLSNVAPLSTHKHRADGALHTATIVLMDGEHRRHGETAWQRSFRVEGTKG
jgi:hypothetical protein